MPKNKLCCRVFPIVSLLISTVISAALWYFDEGVHRFVFLSDSQELINFIGTVLFVAILPIGLFYYFNDKEKYENKARQLALLGFLPALALLGFILL